ncbi:hypothetical protein [Paenibacillus xanthanilyticus]|uniref:Uncharacterized protein n=1 Tax=Paenibacillus xanthanilyticus TaxID=1783531 RepID=A0ABV8KE30_9BACL
MASRIFSFLDELQHDLFREKLAAIEPKYFELCSGLAGKNEADRIQSIELADYQETLRSALNKAISLADDSSKAIYFEYDLDNDWKSCFYLCNQYNTLEEEDEDWASEWEKHVEGPSHIEFAEIYAEYGFDRSEAAIGNTLYLVARTVVALASVCQTVESHLPISIAFHDQDPIMRIRTTVFHKREVL